jgi:uncharacterized protein (DUF427 family)
VGIRIRDALAQRLADLRYEPTEKRIRATLGGQTIVDSTRAVLVWEPRRVVPSYAVPVEEIRAELTPAEPRPDDGPELLHPGIPFAVHSTPGQSFAVRAGDQVRQEAAFRPDDPDLADHAVLDFRAFDTWHEEDDRMVGHPRDPFHRVDIRPSSRHVRIELDGQLLAETRRATLVFETGLPVRFYLPRADVVADVRRSDRKTHCAYKGEASYWSLVDHRNIAWTYRDPLPDAGRLAGLVAFFDELVDVTVDGQPRTRPDTPVTRAMLDESGH